MKDALSKRHRLRLVDGIRSSSVPAGGPTPPPPTPPSWSLPGTISISQSGTVGLRQYLNNGDGLTIVVANLPAGVTYNAATESLEGASTGTSSGTVTFTAGSAVDTATVALVEPAVGYDLAAAIAAVPFAVNLPAEPVITSEATCTTTQQITDSLAVNGRRTIIAPGSYSLGSFALGGNNKHVLIQPGATLSVGGLAFFGASAVVIEGGAFTCTNGFAVEFVNCSDVAFRGVTMNCTQAGLYFRDALRVLLEGTSITAATGGAFLAGPWNVNEQDSNMIVLANSELVSTAPNGVANSWAIRWSSPGDNMVALDSRFRSLANVAVRYEGILTNGYFARNQIECEYYAAVRTTRDGEVPGTSVTNWWFVDNEIYALNDSLSATPESPNVARVDVGSYPTLTNVVATGNRTYGPNNVTNAGFRTGQSTWTTSDNLHTLTGGYPSPPAWEIQ